ncbi:hypothetical protein Drorol1_Dr00027487 [Drosera rotundifolia]
MRRQSLTIPTSNGHHHITTTPPSQSPFDFELVSLNSPTYISLRDLTSPPSPSIILSPPSASITAIFILSANSNASSAASGYEIRIRNRLVKQAASAYLHPMSMSPSSSRSGRWRRTTRMSSDDDLMLRPSSMNSSIRVLHAGSGVLLLGFVSPRGATVKEEEEKQAFVEACCLASFHPVEL